MRDDDEFRRRQVEGQLETRPGRLRLEFVESVVHEVVEPDLGRLRATDVAVVLRDLRVDVHDVFDRLHIVERLDRRRVPVVVRIVAQELGDAVDVREVVRDVMARRAEEDAQFLHAAELLVEELGDDAAEFSDLGDQRDEVEARAFAPCVSFGGPAGEDLQRARDHLLDDRRDEEVRAEREGDHGDDRVGVAERDVPRLDLQLRRDERTEPEVQDDARERRREHREDGVGREQHPVEKARDGDRLGFT